MHVIRNGLKQRTRPQCRQTQTLTQTRTTIGALENQLDAGKKPNASQTLYLQFDRVRRISETG